MRIWCSVWLVICIQYPKSVSASLSNAYMCHWWIILDDCAVERKTKVGVINYGAR